MGRPRSQRYMRVKISEAVSLGSPVLQSESERLESIEEINAHFNRSFKHRDLWNKPSPPLPGQLQHIQQYQNQELNPELSRKLQMTNQDGKIMFPSPQQTQKELEAKYTVFVGNITSDTTQHDLISLFSQFGPVEVVLMKKNDDGLSYQDYCFVRFQHTESVQKALAYPDHLTLNNLVLHVKPRTATSNKHNFYRHNKNYYHQAYKKQQAQLSWPYVEIIPNIPFSTIMVKNIPVIWTAYDLHVCFSTFGVVVGSFIFYLLDESGQKYGLVELKSQAVAYDLSAKRLLQTAVTMESLEVTMVVLNIIPTDVGNLAEWLGSGLV